MLRKLKLCVVALTLSLLCGCSGIDNVIDCIVDKAEDIVASDSDKKLYYSLSEYNYNGMREAVEAGANVNRLKYSLTGESPLHWLLTSEGEIGYDLYGNCTNLDFVEYLLNEGADPDETDSNGRTLVMLCCGADNIIYMASDRILELLCRSGADVTAADNHGYTALDYAVMHGDVNNISLLLKYGAQPDSQTLELAFLSPRDDVFLIDRAEPAKMILDTCPDISGEISPILLSAARGDSDNVVSMVGDCPDTDLPMLAQLAVAFCGLDAVTAVKAAGFDFTVWRDGETSDDGWLYVELALSNGQTDTALWLLDEIGYTEADALVYSAMQGLRGMVEFFLNRGALESLKSNDCRITNYNELLRLSVGDAEVLRLLYKAGYSADKDTLATALNQAIVCGEIDSVRCLCEKFGADAAYIPDGIRSAMDTACLAGNIEAVKYLQSQNASLKAEDGYLCGAVKKHHTELAAYLLAQGVSPDSREVWEDGEDFSPLIIAVKDGRLELVKLLVNAGADVNMRMSSGFTALHYTAMSQSADVLRCLIDAGADVKAADSDGKTAVDIAASDEIAEILRAAGND